MRKEVEEDKTVCRFPTQYLQVKLPDENSVVLDQNLSNSDPAWTAVGVSNVSTIKNTMKNTGVSAIFGDMRTKALVYYIYGTQDTYEIFDISAWEDDKILEYAKGLYGIENAAEGTTVEFGVYKHSQTKFFTIDIKESGETNGESLIYATIINGMLIEFFMDNQSVGGINEGYLRKIVENASFTRIMTKEEYNEAVDRTWRIIIIVFSILISLLVIFIVINKISKKRRKQRNDRVAQVILEFRKRKQSGDVNIKDVIGQVDSVYDSKMIDNFVVFNTWLKPIGALLVWAVLYIVVLYLMIGSASSLAIVIAIAIGVVLLYYIYSKSEKYKENLNKQYDVKSKKQATFRFYEEYFTMSGVNSISEFIYAQIISVKRYKNYIYLYMSDTYAVMIDFNDSTDENMNNIVSHIKDNIKKI